MITAARKIGDSAVKKIRCSNYTGWPTSSICTSSTKKGVVIERRCGDKHCKKKREGCNKEKKDQTHHKEQKGTVSNIKK